MNPPRQIHLLLCDVDRRDTLGQHAMVRVEFAGINKTYDQKVVALRNLDLVVEDKEFVVLVGPSGCGKSTT